MIQTPDHSDEVTCGSMQQHAKLALNALLEQRCDMLGKQMALEQTESSRLLLCSTLNLKLWLLTCLLIVCAISARALASGLLEQVHEKVSLSEARPDCNHVLHAFHCGQLLKTRLLIQGHHGASHPFAQL